MNPEKPSFQSRNESRGAGRADPHRVDGQGALARIRADGMLRCPQSFDRHGDLGDVIAAVFAGWAAPQIDGAGNGPVVSIPFSRICSISARIAVAVPLIGPAVIDAQGGRFANSIRSGPSKSLSTGMQHMRSVCPAPASSAW